MDNTIFEAYLLEFSKQNPREYKIVVINKFSFSCNKKYIEMPKNIYLLRIPPYTPEPNACEQIWQYIKHPYKNRHVESMKQLRTWLDQTVNNMDKKIIKTITVKQDYKKQF